MAKIEKQILSEWKKLTAEEKQKVINKIKERVKNKEER